MGLLDYYRQFEGVPEEEVNRGLREDAAERRRKALTRVTTLDLSQTTWPDLPHASIVNAITFTARAGLQRYPHLRGSRLRSELADRHDVPAGRLILGNGAAELLSAATRALMEPGQELLTSWPSYPLFPLMARRAHGRAVPVGGGVDALLAAAAEHNTRVVALANPNDPTGELLAAAELERLLAGLPEGIAVLLDEALIDFADAQPTNASLKLAGGAPSPVRLSQLLQGMGPGGVAHWLRHRRPWLGAAAGRAGTRSRRQRALAGGGARGAALRCQAARAPCGERLRGALTANHGAAQAHLRGDRQPGQLPVGRPPAARRRRAGQAPGAARGCWWQPGPDWASRDMYASRCATPPPPTACWRRSTKRSAEPASGAGRLGGVALPQ